MDDCPTTYGRRNKFRSVVDMMKRLKEIAVPVAAAAKMTAEQLEGKVLTGVLYKEERPEYCEQYANVIERSQGA
jgi:2-oxoglutarate ferredoxin oxidoreductase subunit beta